MKKTALRFAALGLVLLCSAQPARATRILIVTDQPKAVKAREVAALFSSVEPYSLMKDLSLKVIQTSSSKLGCQSAAPSALDVISATAQDTESNVLLQESESRDRLAISLGYRAHLTVLNLPPSCDNKSGGVPSRLITCETRQSLKYLAALKKTEKASYAIIVKDESRYGGSGGLNPVITTGSPAAMALHELMHRLGFADEYSYHNSCEADLYCPAGGDDWISPSGYGAHPTTSFNVAVFTPQASYASNAEVRAAHGKQIPWLIFIDKSTDIMKAGKIGTPPSPHAGVIGLYRSTVCDQASVTTPTWQSISQPTIMKTLSTTYIPKDYWATIATSLGTHLK